MNDHTKKYVNKQLSLLTIFSLLSTLTISVKDFSSSTSISLGGIFPYDDATSQYAFEYAIEEYMDLFESEFNITLNTLIETTGNLSTPGMGALDAVSRLLDDGNDVVGIVGFESPLDIVVTSNTLDQATVKRKREIFHMKIKYKIFYRHYKQNRRHIFRIV